MSQMLYAGKSANSAFMDNINTCHTKKILRFNNGKEGQCFVHNEGGLRTLPYRAHYNNFNTIENCKKACFSHNYRYAGVQYAKECYCGNNAPKKVAPKETDCNMDCSGDKSQKCGGGNRMNVYKNKGEIT